MTDENNDDLILAFPEKITPQMLKAWIESERLEDNYLAYETLTGKAVPGYEPTQKDSEFLLEFLLACITADLEWNWKRDLHTKADALWQLLRPTCIIWRREGTAMDADIYWAWIAEYLVERPNGYDDAFTTHFLELCPHDRPFHKTMRQWKKHPKLKRYVEELTGIIGRSF